MAKNYKTIALTGTEQKVVLAGQNCDIRNDSVDIVYASAEAGITSGADGVLSIPAGQAAKLLDCRGTLYILGTGSAMLCGNDYSELVFKSAASVSGGGGGTVDDVARQAISSHANNEEIHLTAEEREAWNDALNASAVVTGVGLGFAANQTVTVEEFIEALVAKFGNEKIVLSRVAWATFDSITITDGATSISFNGGFITGMVCSTDKAWHNTRLMYCQGDGGDNNDVYLIRGYATDDVAESNYTITKINNESSNPNLLDNPDFRINQRGVLEYGPARAYTVDRWIGDTKSKVEILDSGRLKITLTTNIDSNWWVLRQLLENISTSSTRTMSINVVDISGDYWYMVASNQFGSSHLQEGINYANIPSFNTNDAGIAVVPGATTGDYIEIEWIKLEAGSIATPFTPPSHATELMKCQRHYQIRSTGDIDPVDLRPSMATITDIKERSDGNYEYIAEEL